MRGTQATAVRTQCDTGSGAAATIQIQTSGNVEICTITMTVKASHAFGANQSGTITANNLPLSGTCDAGGTAAKFVVYDCDGVAVFFGTVGLSASDMNLTNLTYLVGDTITLSTFAYSAPL